VLILSNEGMAFDGTLPAEYNVIGLKQMRC